MSNLLLLLVCWVAVAVHALVAFVVARRLSDLPLVPWVNLAVALCVLTYWIPRWYGYAVKGITWYASDQLLPAYALLAGVLAVLSLTGRYGGTVPDWIVFGLDALALLGAACFFTFFRMDRLV